MQKQYIILAFTLLLSTVCYGWSDPKGILQQVDEYLGQPGFGESFIDGTDGALVMKECQPFLGCSEMRSGVRVTVQDRVASLDYYRPDGEVTQHREVTAEQWLSWKGNMLRPALQAMESGGFKIELQSLEKSKITVSLYGNLTQFESRTVGFRGNNPTIGSINGQITVCAELPGVFQQVVKTENHSKGSLQREWRLLAVSRE